jgi:hypothetical protein
LALPAPPAGLSRYPGPAEDVLDFICFVMSSGNVIMYFGDDPGFGG